MGKKMTWDEGQAKMFADAPNLKLVTRQFFKYSSRLKALSVAFLVVSAAFFFGGCADPLEKGTVREVPEKFERGITGNGTLGPRDTSDDPNMKSMHP
jgi:hypothetical protein